MIARVLYVSASGSSAVIAVDHTEGEIKQSVTGFVMLGEGISKSVGETLDLGSPSKIEVVKRPLKDEEGNVVQEFDWFQFQY